MLMHHPDALAHGVQRRFDFDRLTVDQDFAFVGWIEAVQNFHQRRFARAVFAKERVNLAGVHIEMDVIVGEHAGKVFGNVA